MQGTGTQKPRLLVVCCTRSPDRPALGKQGADDTCSVLLLHASEVHSSSWLPMLRGTPTPRASLVPSKLLQVFCLYQKHTNILSVALMANRQSTRFQKIPFSGLNTFDTQQAVKKALYFISCKNLLTHAD